MVPLNLHARLLRRRGLIGFSAAAVASSSIGSVRAGQGTLAVTGAAAVLRADPILAACPSDPEMMAYVGPGTVGTGRSNVLFHWLGRRLRWAMDESGDGYKDFEGIVKSLRDDLPNWNKTGFRMSFAIAMLPGRGGTVGPGYSLADGAAGKYNPYFKDMAESLVAAGLADAALRLGWEFNGDWYPWSAARDPHAFGRYWQQIVKTMRGVPGQQFLFDWNIGMGGNAMGGRESRWLEDAYPGDDCVDIIGCDFYDTKNGTNSPQEQWSRVYLPQYGGLDWLADFATVNRNGPFYSKHPDAYARAVAVGRAQRKAISFPEVGVGKWSNGNQSFGDNPVFVTNFAAWMRKSPAKVMYFGLWDFDGGGFNGRLSGGASAFPEAAFAWRTQFAAPPCPVPDEPPGAVTDVRIGAVSPTRIEVFWTLPQGGGRVQQILLVQKPTGSAGALEHGPFVGPTATSAVISRLKGPVEYGIQLAASNFSGNSAFTPVLIARTLEPSFPGVPSRLVTTRVGAASFEVQWAKPVDPTPTTGPAVSGQASEPVSYTAQYKAATASDWKTVGIGPGLDASISGLDRNTAYDVRVFANTAAGRGDPATLRVTTGA